MIVPGWGAFVAQYTPAHIDKTTQTLCPPTRSIGFNESLNHNDGLLATSISRHECIGYDEAVNQMSMEVSSLRCQLNSDGEVSMGHVGTFTLNAAGGILFTPFDTPVAAPAYYGLPSIAVTKVIKAAKQERTIQEKQNWHHRRRFSTIASRVTRIAASIALLIGLGVVLSTPVIVDRQAPSLASVSAMTSVTTPKPVSPASLLPTTSEANLYLAVTSQGMEVADTAARSRYSKRMASLKDLTRGGLSSAQPSIPVRLNDTDPYCLVVASLASREDADRYMSQRHDGPLRCLEKDGKFRIYAATGSTAAEASAPTRQAEFSRRYPGAWVCHR